MQLNDVGREIPKKVGSNSLKPYRNDKLLYHNKLIENIEKVIEKTNLKNGMTISFHHHFRDGDIVLNKVLDIISKKNIKNLTLVATSLRNIHEPIINHIKNNVIRKIYTSGLRGKIGREIQSGILDEPVIIYSHGGRAGAIETGKIEIDVAFIAASSADSYGNLTGIIGKSVCGSLGYAKVDAKNANKVVGITDNLVGYPLDIISISQKYVDYLVEIDSIGDSNKIATGSLRKLNDPKKKKIAEYTIEVIKQLKYFKDGFSLQTGSGSISLMLLTLLKETLEKEKIKGSFLLGGITQDHVKLLEEGYFNKIFDTQTFDPKASESIYNNKDHIEIDGFLYASYFCKSPLVNNLDIVVLSALEVDIDYNVNVITASDGRFHGASGGHSDTAAGSKISIVVIPTTRGRIPSIKKRVNTIVTPGKDIDIIVTERGICINPESEIKKSDFNSGNEFEIIDIKRLKKRIEEKTGVPKDPKYTDDIVGLVEYRDGSIIDVIKAIKD